MSSQCPGCSREFTFSGLPKHLAQTINPACLAARGGAAVRGTSVDLTESDIPDLDAPAVPFVGDFFGPYNAADFPDDEELTHDAFELDSSLSDSDDDEDDALAPSASSKTFIVRFPGVLAGAPVVNMETTSRAYWQYQDELDGHSAPSNAYYPFVSKTDWEVARWAKMRGPGSTSFSELLTIQGVAERLELSYKNSRELNKIIDKLPSARPQFERHEIVIADEAFEVFYRNILECIKALLGDPEFAPLLLLVPERHYADEQHTVPVYFDMNTGKWWWATQTALEKEHPGATVIPIIISSDKTQLTLIGNKSAYPVYMTLGNLPKDIRCKPSRRGQILLAYLPTSRLLHITNKSARRRTLANLFHACMSRVLAPLSSAGVNGMHFASGDGIIRRGHPILATYVGDYPEQVLVTGCKTGECPKCEVPRDKLGDSVNLTRPLRDLGNILDALAALDEGVVAFTQACRTAGIKPLHHPFWEDLPYTNIFVAITPDILHQLYQGVIKHLLAWIQTAYGPDEIDARCRRLPPSHSLRHFSKGISSLSRVTGKEHQDISRILLGLIIGLQLPHGASSARLVRATRALLDFLYLAQYPCHTSKTLKLLDEALLAFHANKDIFCDLNIREHFRLPKLHFLEHYRRSIELFGTTDNYDTQFSERLHIDFAKEAYRASNRKDEFVQMTHWLERKEKVQQHEKYVEWRLRATMAPSPNANPEARPSRPLMGDLEPATHIRMSCHPSAKAVSLDDIVTKYGARYFRDALARFVTAVNHPAMPENQIELASGSIYLPFRALPVYHKIKFLLQDTDGLGVTHYQAQDVAHARPAHQNKYGGSIGGRFDTVLVRAAADIPERLTIQGYRIGQVRLVFTIPQKVMDHLFPQLNHESRLHHLAYVEWFTPSSAAPHPDHGLYRLSRLIRHGHRLSSIIPVQQIERACHLFPDFGPVAPRAWTSDTVLEECTTFWLNTFSDRYMYMTIH
ncbi:hypothetical protein BD414DRAFT_547770 [Trametes punicea]|nr:hypothetical protein BD414DRAFT_547770 [Trametes punicea]